MFNLPVHICLQTTTTTTATTTIVQIVKDLVLYCYSMCHAMDLSLNCLTVPMKLMTDTVITVLML